MEERRALEALGFTGFFRRLVALRGTGSSPVGTTPLSLCLCPVGWGICKQRSWEQSASSYALWALADVEEGSRASLNSYGRASPTLSDEAVKRIAQLRREIAERVAEYLRITDTALGREPIAHPVAVYIRGILPLGHSNNPEPVFRLATELDNLSDNIDECEKNGGTVESAVDEEGDNHWGCHDPSTGTCHEI